MKTVPKFLFAAIFSCAASVVFAGPGPQYWNRPARSSAVSAETPVKQNKDGAVVTCVHMLVKNTGPGSSRVPRRSVNCTPELLRTNADCQRDCGVGGGQMTPASPTT
jgi:hypothetical protein